MSRWVLYSLPNSFYSARCRAVAYAKGIALQIEAPPGGLGSAQFREISPLGKVPALSTPAGVLVESQIICEYLEQLYPTPALLPADAWHRARTQLLCRYIDLHLASRILVAPPGAVLATAEPLLLLLEVSLVASKTGPDPLPVALCQRLPLRFFYPASGFEVARFGKRLKSRSAVQSSR